MIEDELVQIWQSSPLREQIKFEKSKLMLEVQSGLKTFDGLVKLRDFTEIGVGIVLIPLFTFEVFRQPALISKIGAFCIVLWLVYVIYSLLKVKRSKPLENTIFLDYLKENKAYLERHKSMAKNVLYWYILPSLLGVILFAIGILDVLNKPILKIFQLKEVWVFILGISLITIYTIWVTKKLTKKVLNPRIRKIDELINSLTAEDV